MRVRRDGSSTSMPDLQLGSPLPKLFSLNARFPFQHVAAADLSECHNARKSVLDEKQALWHCHLYERYRDSQSERGHGEDYNGSSLCRLVGEGRNTNAPR